MSFATDIADAVAMELNAADSGSFSQTFTAERSVLPVHELKDLIDLKVAIVPKVVEISGSTRSVSQYDIAVDIGVQKKLATTDIDTEVATLGTLVDEIADYLRRRPLTAAPHAVWVNTVNEPVYAPEHLAEQRVFTSVLTVTYRAMK
jgi:hypothetical protein